MYAKTFLYTVYVHKSVLMWTHHLKIMQEALFHLKFCQYSRIIISTQNTTETDYMYTIKEYTIWRNIISFHYMKSLHCSNALKKELKHIPLPGMI